MIVEPGRARVHRRRNSTRFVRVRADLQPGRRPTTSPYTRAERRSSVNSSVPGPPTALPPRASGHGGDVRGVRSVHVGKPRSARSPLPQAAAAAASAGRDLAAVGADARHPRAGRRPSVDARVRGRWRRAGGGQTPRARLPTAATVVVVAGGDRLIGSIFQTARAQSRPSSTVVANVQVPPRTSWGFKSPGILGERVYG